MKKILGNSCAKGCLIYGVVLLAIVAVTAFGLGGLKAKFGASSQGPQVSASTQSAGGSQASQGTQASTQKSGPIVPILAMASPQPPATLQPTAVVASSTNSTGNSNQAGAGANAVAPTQESAQPIPPTLPKGAPAGSVPAVNSQAVTSADAQGGTISGGASAPYYVVQAGDTLWSISQRFRVDLDALRSMNDMPDNTIYPGQTVSLPQEANSQQTTAQQATNGGSANQEPAQNAGQGTGQSASQGTTNGPAENNAGSTGATSNTTSGLPNMPDTGINKKP